MKSFIVACAFVAVAVAFPGGHPHPPPPPPPEAIFGCDKPVIKPPPPPGPPPPEVLYRAPFFKEINEVCDVSVEAFGSLLEAFHGCHPEAENGDRKKRQTEEEIAGFVECMNAATNNEYSDQIDCYMEEMEAKKAEIEDVAKDVCGATEEQYEQLEEYHDACKASLHDQDMDKRSAFMGSIHDKMQKMKGCMEESVGDDEEQLGNLKCIGKHLKEQAMEQIIQFIADERCDVVSDNLATIGGYYEECKEELPGPEEDEMAPENLSGNDPMSVEGDSLSSEESSEEVFNGEPAGGPKPPKHVIEMHKCMLGKAEEGADCTVTQNYQCLSFELGNVMRKMHGKKSHEK